MPELSVSLLSSRICPADRVDLMYGECCAVFDVMMEHAPDMEPNLDDILDCREVLGHNCRRLISILQEHPVPGTGRILEFIMEARREAEETANHEALSVVLRQSDA